MTPAETPTECEYVGNVPVPYCGTHDRPAVTCLDLREKDARIRELVEKVRLATYCDFHEPDGTLDCEECEEARAALARSEGDGK